jgi:hypothetical protein
MTPVFMIAVSLICQQAPTPVGVWTLQSVKIDGRAATGKELHGLLKEHGGVEIGMLYRFRRDQGCRLNELGAWYQFTPESKELLVEHTPEDGKEIGITFDVKFSEKDMKLSFKDKGKKVELLFKRED